MTHYRHWNENLKPGDTYDECWYSETCARWIHHIWKVSDRAHIIDGKKCYSLDAAEPTRYYLPAGIVFVNGTKVMVPPKELQHLFPKFLIEDNYLAFDHKFESGKQTTLVSLKPYEENL